jgi:hypothetical protein
LATCSRASLACLRNDPSGARRLQVSIAALTDAFQWPKIMAPIVKMAVAIEIRIAALFSDMDGVGFMTM